MRVWLDYVAEVMGYVGVDGSPEDVTDERVLELARAIRDGERGPALFGGWAKEGTGNEF